jgi:hypothetical protein
MLMASDNPRDYYGYMSDEQLREEDPQAFQERLMANKLARDNELALEQGRLDQVMQSPEYQALLQQYQNSQGDPEIGRELQQMISEASGIDQERRTNSGDLQPLGIPPLGDFGPRSPGIADPLRPSQGQGRVDVDTTGSPPPLSGTGIGSLGGADAPYVSSIDQSVTTADPLYKQVMFGTDGQGGFLGGAFRAAERTFFDEQGRPIVVPQEIAGLSPDQLQAARMTREQLGVQQPFIKEAARLGRQGVGDIQRGLASQAQFDQEALSQLRQGVGSLETGVREAEDLTRSSVGAFDQNLRDQFFNPFEQQVVQQTIKDITEQGAKQDMAARARNLASGESAFGSRARLGAEERAEALGRGLAESVGALRSRGFSEAQSTALGEFARQQQAKRAAAQGISGLASQRFGGAQQVVGQIGQTGATQAQAGQMLGGARAGLGGTLSALGAQAAGAGAQDVAALQSVGAQQQAQRQRELDAQRAQLLQAQQAPLAQYQALMPFVSMVPQGSSTTQTAYRPAPSALQAGLGTGLATLGALGQFGQTPQQNISYQQPSTQSPVTATPTATAPAYGGGGFQQLPFNPYGGSQGSLQSMPYSPQIQGDPYGQQQQTYRA